MSLKAMQIHYYFHTCLALSYGVCVQYMGESSGWRELGQETINTLNMNLDMWL